MKGWNVHRNVKWSIWPESPGESSCFQGFCSRDAWCLCPQSNNSAQKCRRKWSPFVFSFRSCCGSDLQFCGSTHGFFKPTWECISVLTAQGSVFTIHVSVWRYSGHSKVSKMFLVIIYNPWFKNCLSTRLLHCNMSSILRALFLQGSKHEPRLMKLQGTRCCCVKCEEALTTKVAPWRFDQHRRTGTGNGSKHCSDKKSCEILPRGKNAPPSM